MNNRVIQRLREVFASLGFAPKPEKLTNEQWNQFAAAYKEKFGISYDEDQNTTEQTNAGTDNHAPETQPVQTISPELQAQILQALNTAALATGTDAETKAPATVDESTAALINALNTVSNRFSALAATPEPANHVQTVRASGNMISAQTMAKVLGSAPHTGTHLFGIENEYFARGNWWNEILVKGTGTDSVFVPGDVIAFRNAYNGYVGEFAKRCEELAKSNQLGLLNYTGIIKGESFVDYSRMNLKLGEYVVRRMDTIIAYLRTLESVGNIFPVVSNVQHKMTAPTAFFEELSQSYIPGHYFKGAVNFDGEMYHVDNVMFKFHFEDPRQLEKEYIGYLNREGSNPMKWTLFEWCIVHFGEILFNEQQNRRVVGVSVPRQGTWPQPANFAADGVLRAIQRVEEELKVLPFFDMKIYDRTTIVDYIEHMYEEVIAILPNMNGYRVYANKKHFPWYLKAYRDKYALHQDFTGTNSAILDLSPESIIWVPNMSMIDYKVWITQPRNVENYEDRPNEMYALYFQQDLEQLIIASWWKEGSGVLAPGVQFRTLSDLKEAKRSMQWVFTNYPVIDLDPDATTADGSMGYEFLTGANTGATALTDIVNAVSNRVYKIICGDVANATTIAKAGKFSNITAAWTPTTEGEYIKLYAELQQTTVTVGGKTRTVVKMTGNFLELERG